MFYLFLNSTYYVQFSEKKQFIYKYLNNIVGAHFKLFFLVPKLYIKQIQCYERVNIIKLFA